MTALYIILGIIAFILILLFLPLRVKIEYDGDMKLKLGYAFLNFTILPQKPKKPKKPKKQKKKPEPEKEKTEEKPDKKKNPIMQLKDKHGLDGLIDLIKQIVHIVVDMLGKLARHLKIRNLVINAVIAGEDSADTAMKYGYACSVIYPAVSILESKAVLKKHSEDISAGFLSEKTVIEFKFTAKIRVMFILGAVIPAAFKALKLIIKNKP